MKAKFALLLSKLALPQLGVNRSNLEATPGLLVAVTADSNRSRQVLLEETAEDVAARGILRRQCRQRATEASYGYGTIASLNFGDSAESLEQTGRRMDFGLNGTSWFRVPRRQ